MHKIEIAVQPDCLGGVSQALRKTKLGPFRASAVTIFDPGAPFDGSYRGARYAKGRERVKLELIVQDNELEPAIEAIREGIDAFGHGETELLVLTVRDSVRLSPSPGPRPRAAR